MKKLLIASIACLAVSAHAKDGTYLSAQLGGVNGSQEGVYGANFQNNASVDNKAAMNYTVALGMQSGAIAYEAEFSYSAADVDVAAFNGQDLDIKDGAQDKRYNIMANVYYNFDIKTAPKWKPFVGAGIGMQHIEVSGSNIVTTDKDHSFESDGVSFGAYQAIGGVGYELTKHLELKTDVRYLGTFSKDVEGFEKDASSSQVSYNLGLAYTF